VATDSYAAFAHATYDFSKEWAIAAGLRYTSEEKEIDFSAVGDPFELLQANIAPRTLDQSADDLSHLLTLTFKPDDDLMFYATYSTGFKAGGFNVYSITATEDATYEPETVDNYEIGMKSTFLDGRGRFAASACWMNYNDLQVNQLLLVGGLPQFQTSNAAEAENKGIELELWMEPVDGLELQATYGYLDAEFASYQNATSTGEDFTGNTLPYAPKNNARLAATYFASIGDGLALFLFGEATHRSRVFFEPNNVHSQDAVTLFGARAGITSDDRKWEFIVWGRNLSDEDYAIARYDGVIVPGQITHALGAPMTVGAEFRFKY
jgi:iron complex outermembrane receptor protein